jgi:hypothetical protein
MPDPWLTKPICRRGGGLYLQGVADALGTEIILAVIRQKSRPDGVLAPPDKLAPAPRAAARREQQEELLKVMTVRWLLHRKLRAGGGYVLQITGNRPRSVDAGDVRAKTWVKLYPVRFASVGHEHLAGTSCHASSEGEIEKDVKEIGKFSTKTVANTSKSFPAKKTSF